MDSSIVQPSSAAMREKVTAERAAEILTMRRHRGCVAWIVNQTGESVYGCAEVDCPDPYEVLSSFEAIAIADAYLRNPPVLASAP